MTQPPTAIQKLGQFLHYALGRQPDEFGLVPDEHGYVPTKELLKALHEEPGWRHLRVTHLQQLIAMHRPPPIEMDGQKIRAALRDHLPKTHRPDRIPKLLYIAVRRRAHAAALTHGLRSGNRPYLVLSADRAIAQRMGRRLDHQAVMLTVNVERSQKQGTTFHQFGASLFLADAIAAGAVTGPAPPKEKEPSAASAPKPTITPPQSPGSYFPDWGLTSEEKKTLKRQRRREKMAKEKARRQARRAKTRDRH